MADSVKMLTDVDYQPKKALKRKRAALVQFTDEEKCAKIEGLKKEMEGLFGYYREMMIRKEGFGLVLDLDFSANEGKSTVNGLVALLLEESDLSLSRLVEEIYGKLVKESVNVTPAVVKSAVLLVGQRLMYGVPNVDADVLEDETQACLWCWETRDLKLMPKFAHGTLKIRRMCRKKIHERITAVSALITALEKSESDDNYICDLIKASEKLGKVLTEADIRLLVDGMLQRNGAEMVEKKAKHKEKLVVKQLEKNKREVEKEKKRIDIELQKEKRQIEKEQKRLQDEAEKDERRREKEESELRRQQRKQQEEAEKHQRRREKEEAELKKRLAIQKQASIMERFLKRSKTNSPGRIERTSTKATISDSLCNESEKMPEAATELMDSAFLANDDFAIYDILGSHLSSWHRLGHSIRSNKKQHWSIRQKPKTQLFKELKLTASRELAHDDELSVEKLVSEWEDETSDERSCITNSQGSPPDINKCKLRKQLLQFDKSHRPAFYGIWPKKSHVVGPRHPFAKEPDLDYVVDSDEEWEEENPGESLSDCDKDDDEESFDEGCSKVEDEEESEDGFFVPDGYLSENEGVQVDRMETDLSVEMARSSPSYKQDLESEDFNALLRQQKYLTNLTNGALKKNQPFIILNLVHEKIPLLVSEDLVGVSKVENMCLQALSICAFPCWPSIEISMDNMQGDNQDACLSNGKASTTPSSTVMALQPSDVPLVVSAIQSCSQSINKVVESLQQKFPAVSKSQLRNKVREISDFVDNRWQVKKEILDEVGVPISLDQKRGGRTKNIAKFFSKRCLPPTDKNINPKDSSPQPSMKHGSVDEKQRVCTFGHLPPFVSES